MLWQWKYFFREVHPKEIAGTINLVEGQEIIFRCGPSDGEVIDKPDPEYCNIKLALAHAMNTCGAADIIAEMYGDNNNDEAIGLSFPMMFFSIDLMIVSYSYLDSPL